MSEFRIRAAQYEDLPRLAEISRSTWEGSDYLEEVAASWISEGGLFLGQVGELVVGTVKLTRLPDRVIWLEGLRVHPDHRSRGYGRRLVEHVFNIGLASMEAGEAESMEFATYFGNRESIAIASEMGFGVVASFYILASSSGRASPAAPPVPLKSAHSQLRDCGSYLSAGWTFVHNTREGREWILERTRALSWQGAAFLAHRKGGCYIPLPDGLDTPEELLEGIGASVAARGLSEHNLIVPGNRAGLLDLLSAGGYESWEELDGPNMLVFRYDGS